MRKCLLLLTALLCLGATARAQEVSAGSEHDSIRRVVETFLYTEEPEERKSTLYEGTKILGLAPGGAKVLETPVSRPAKKLPKGTVTKSRQKIAGIDATDYGATVRVETELPTDGKHTHYLSLLKVGGQWKIVSILMPPVTAMGDK